ncbi:14766_t:CDS:2 [Funneliformis geosporum]|uniref:14766_t:CDS:1 n=1 Tax=Funneliformis geosporum TaxID=1117311 RepID=A0A9W4SV81_9GLOM|nr:14766_t:CDS:2 [Funneliformis geosporum]
MINEGLGDIVMIMKLEQVASRKKANVENGYKEENERLKTQGDSYLKEIERAKHHEERGKIKCLCGFCEQEAIIRGEVKTKIRKEQKQAEKDKRVRKFVDKQLEELLKNDKVYQKAIKEQEENKKQMEELKAVKELEDKEKLNNRIKELKEAREKGEQVIIYVDGARNN